VGEGKVEGRKCVDIVVVFMDTRRGEEERREKV
jgi:hypothetical protein